MCCFAEAHTMCLDLTQVICKTKENSLGLRIDSTGHDGLLAETRSISTIGFLASGVSYLSTTSALH